VRKEQRVFVQRKPPGDEGSDRIRWAEIRALDGLFEAEKGSYVLEILC